MSKFSKIWRFLRNLLLGALAMLVLGIAVFGAIAYFEKKSEIGIAEDFKDVDFPNIIAFAERANAAYHEAKVFRFEYGSHAEDGEFPISGLRIYLDTDPKTGVQWVILRGTANMPNIFDDLDFVGRGEHELGINVHAGFDQALQECLPWVLQRLDPKRPVWVTGHSLGGAVAVLLVATLDHRGFEDVTAITFGQPKFTDAHGAEKLSHLKLLRIVHDEDPVPMLPPAIVGGAEVSSYRHFGPELLVSANGHFSYLPEHAADRINVARYWADLENIRPICHDMTKGYLPALKNAMGKTVAGK